MRRQLVATTLMAVMALAGRTLAHEGHEHKVMGKVIAIDEKTIQVEGLDGMKVSGVLGPETKYLRDNAPAARGDVKVGERVVIVVAEEKKVQKVKRVLLGAPAADKHEGAQDKR